MGQLLDEQPMEVSDDPTQQYGADEQPMEVSDDPTQQYGADAIPEEQNHPDAFQDGSAEGDIDPCAAFTPVAATLQTEAGFPETHLAKDLAGWLIKNNRRLSAKAREDFPRFVDKVRLAYNDLPLDERPNLGDLATQWGLPPFLAEKLHPNTLYKIVAAAVVLAA
jgi:hypothetical protein